MVRRGAYLDPDNLPMRDAAMLCAQNAAYLYWGSEDQSIVTAYTFSTLDVGGLKIAVSRLIRFRVSNK